MTRQPVDLFVRHDPAPFCAACSKCCEAMPGQAIPSDFGWERTPTPANEEALAEMLRGGWIIDYWEGDPDVFYLRARAVNDPDGPVHGSWGGRCVWLDDRSGCTAPVKPAACAALEPEDPALGGSCVSKLSKFEWAQAWVGWQETLVALV